MEYIILASMGFFAALTPGPDIFYIIRQGLCKGKTSAFLAVAGILTGNIVYLTLVGIGLGSIGHNPYFQMIVGIAGGIYLLRIAKAVFNEKVHIEKSCDNLRKFDIYKEALFLNLSNPKAMIFFAVVITPFMSKNVMLSLISLYIGITFAFIIAAYFSSKLNIEEKIMNAVNKISSALFLFFALSLFYTAYKAFLSL
ncbi:L-lysine/ homoserine-homoserine lactone exporter family [Nautilia profundicola AmH]|uniref:L-lysine/ homoserine-homoserine lactone exporter family n=1 Tax=Nautilia profundicola (strain ATCC BAA-1463 / DSM 18972 / AmH) TaxID=598659 RepID=B9L9X2_NAUPA|nr:LysE family translocator [Nautilia profundicola]ACM92188.1 L-lysine/ homoserine-homoserine lactone exporter family [Nautilia profundicola AmH]